ncbi:MAG: holo-ACP synthase [Treponema sp.]|nr:holo-ACP synthase [Treponema sp.]
MVFGIGVDVCKIERFEKLVEDEKFIKRYFNPKEIREFDTKTRASEYYASRFAVKEAFSKALGTGLKGFELKDIFVVNNEQGKPEIQIEKSVTEVFTKICPGGKINLSISHEKEYAAAFVVIEQ